MREISGVVFDFGGVMTLTTMPERVRAITEELGVPWKVLEEGYGRYRRVMDGGFITIAELYDLIWADADLDVSDETKARIVKADVASFMCRNERTLAWMRALKSRGLRIGILTNMPPEFAVEFRRAFPDFIAAADAMVISGEERMFKPQRRIYDLLASRIGLAPGELCFIDDSPANCAGALAAGWRAAVRFVSNEQAERETEALLDG